MDIGEVKLYPNPGTNWLSISAEKKVNSICISNANGQILKVFQTNLTTHKSIDFGSFSKGVYPLQLGFEDGEFATRKIIK